MLWKGGAASGEKDPVHGVRVSDSSHVAAWSPSCGALRRCFSSDLQLGGRSVRGGFPARSVGTIQL